MKRLTSILFLPLFFILSGCFSTEYNLATKREETLIHGVEKEIKIGDAVSRKLESKYEINSDIDLNEQVERVLDRIVNVCDRKELVYIIKIIDSDELNAISLPGGYLYIFKGLMDKIQTDDQLAGIIAHEVGHITAKHAMKRLQGSYGALVVQVLAVGSGNPDAAGAVNLTLATIMSGYSQQDEFEADRLAVKYTKKAGYDPNEMMYVLELLRQEMWDSPRRPIAMFRSHPHLNERMAALNKELKGKVEFRDYLNLTEEDYEF